jgi:hypothetical protein
MTGYSNATPYGIQQKNWGRAYLGGEEERGLWVEAGAMPMPACWLYV